MARPIPVELAARDPREELRSRLASAPAEHAEAVLGGFEVLQALHDGGVLELLRGVLRGGDKILEVAVETAKTPQAIRGMRNLLIMAKMVGAFDPDQLKKLADAVPGALVAVAQAQEKEPPGFWEALRMLRSKNLRRGLAMTNGAIEALGGNLSTGKS